MFKVRDFAKVKLKNEKRAFKEFEELFSTQIVSDEFILDLVQSYRRNITRYEVEFNFEGNVMEIVYDDYTKFDISKIDNYYQENFARHGSFNKAMFRLKQGGHIISKSYQ